MNRVFKLLIVTLSVAAGGLWLNTAHAASFDCAKARTKVEKMICANKDLSEWDSSMAQSYQLDMMWKSQAKWVKRTQLSWLKRRNKCQDVSCLKKAYLVRIYQLSNPPGHEGYWINDPYNPGIGQNSALARALLKRLNSFKWKSDQCSGSVVVTYKGFSEPPWRKLDPSKHLILIYKLLVSGGSVHGLKYYYNGEPRKPPSVEEMRKRAEQFIKRGGELLVWHARLLNDDGELSHPFPPGKQTIVELRVTANNPIGLAMCRGKPAASSSGSTYIVTPDLSGPDPHVTQGIASGLSSGVLLFDHNKLYLIAPGPTLYRMMNPKDPRGWPRIYCSFRYKEFKKERKQ